MGVRSLGNAIASFGYKFGTTGTEASGQILSASGGTTVSNGGYKYHIFTSSGSFVINSGGGGAVFDYVVVAGGGSGIGSAVNFIVNGDTDV